MEETIIYSKEEFDKEYIIQTLKEIFTSLEEKGYDAKNQIVGYLVSGDPGYISNYQEARTKITKINRIKLLEILVDGFTK